MEYYEPKKVDEVVTLLSQEARPEIVAGGQSVMPMLRQDDISPTALVDISGLDGLDTITDDEIVRIGALVRYSDVLNHDICGELDLLRESIEGIADKQIRNVGTIGGGVAHGDPAQDLPPVLQCYEATVTTAPDGETYDLTEFYVNARSTELPPTQLLTSIKFDRPPATAGGSYESYGRYGYSDAGIAALVVPGDTGYDDVRIACAAGGPSPQRVPEAVESELESGLAMASIATAGEMLVEHLTVAPDADNDKEHLEHVFQVLLKRALVEATERSAGPDIDTV